MRLGDKEEIKEITDEKMKLWLNRNNKQFHKILKVNKQLFLIYNKNSN